MRIYQNSCEEYEEGIAINVDSDVLKCLIAVFKENIKEVVEDNDFEAAGRLFKDLEVLKRKLNELTKREGKANE